MSRETEARARRPAPKTGTGPRGGRDTERRHALEVFPKRDITIVKGSGAEVWDDRGRRYIDCVAGIGVASVGHANPAVAKALAEQARTLVTCPGIFYNDVRARLLEKLASVAPPGLSRGFLCNSGAEAVEAAIKFARLATGRTGIVSAVRGFHGRTLGALSATYRKEYREPFEPLVPDFSFAPFNNPGKLREAVGVGTAAVLIEPVQGEGGIRPAGADYLLAAREICDETGALLVLDEIQTGFCRTGRMFACERHGVVPDMLCLAKGIAGGVPLGAVLANDRIRPPPGRHGTTFGGNPLACAAALAAIDFMEAERLGERAEQLGARFRERFEARLPARVRAVRQVGLMIGVELGEACRPYIEALAERSVLALAAGTTVIRLLPPLVIAEEQVDEVTEALAGVLG
ncbi:MAG: acetylornithine/succinylornithine family transaminase [Gemmatimonadota bacterium]|nr:acetylornithine/succinylornithine family transaminase [Gemmatimonadota bacterium]